MDRSNPKDESPTIDEKRAEYERMSMTVCENGYVNVCNQSHSDDSNHTYSVKVRGGQVMSCSCPHHVHRGAECKHMVSVMENPLVLSAASCASQRVLTDGGEDKDKSDRPTHSEHADFGGGEESGMDDLGEPNINHDDEEQSTALLGTVTGWEPKNQTHEDEEVDTTPL